MDYMPDLESALKAESRKAQRAFTEEINLVQALKSHAIANYTAGGWDVVVECYEDLEIAEILTEANAHTLDQAIAAFAFLVDVWAERQADARISAGCTCDGTGDCHCHD